MEDLGLVDQVLRIRAGGETLNVEHVDLHLVLSSVFDFQVKPRAVNCGRGAQASILLAPALLDDLHAGPLLHFGDRLGVRLVVAVVVLRADVVGEIAIGASAEARPLKPLLAALPPEASRALIMSRRLNEGWAMRVALANFDLRHHLAYMQPLCQESTSRRD